MDYTGALAKFAKLIGLAKKAELAVAAARPSPLTQLQMEVLQPAQSQRVRELLAPHNAIGKTPTDNSRIVTNMMMDDSENYPTTVFHKGEGPAVGAYQLSTREDSTYLPFIQSYDEGNGVGSSMLQHAYDNSPTKPVWLHSIPGMEDWYRNRQGWDESIDDGISKFTHKYQGGLL